MGSGHFEDRFSFSAPRIDGALQSYEIVCGSSLGDAYPACIEGDGVARTMHVIRDARVMNLHMLFYFIPTRTPYSDSVTTRRP